MDDKFQYDVFLSFASKDEERVKSLWSELTSSGLRVFWSDQTLKESIGQSFFSVIQNALSESEHFLLFCTEYAMESKWVRLEYETFFREFNIHNKERRLVLYHNSDFDRIKIPPFLRGLQTSTDIKEIIFLLGGEDIKMIKEENLYLKIEINKINDENKLLRYENDLMKNKISLFEKKPFELSGDKKKNILLIDDDQRIHVLLKEELEYIGYNIFSAYSGNEGLDLFKKTCSDLVILDINMPDINGIEILSLLKEEKNTIPVILYSAYPEFKQDLGVWSANDYIVKSYDMKDLLDSIRKNLE